MSGEYKENIKIDKLIKLIEEWRAKIELSFSASRVEALDYCANGLEKLIKKDK